MYSLYRAWFGGAEESGSSGYPRLETTGLAPPDTLVRVGNDGEYHFVAHRAVLAAHSGYLKALLAATASADAASGATGSASHEGHAPMITSITVPSTIGGEAFAPLLNYMYTGRLEVSLDNIYTVLLATHLLHMPGALEQCRAALLRLRAPPAVVPPVSTTTSSPSATQQQQHSASSSVLRPVPNRLLGPAFCWPQSAASHLYPPHLPPHLPPALQLPPAMSLLPGPIMHKSAVSYGTKERSVSPASTSSQQAAHQPRSTSVSPELVVASSASSTTEAPQSGTRGPSPSASSGRVSVSDSNPDNLQSQSQPPKSSSSATATRRRQSSSGGTRQRQNSRSGRISQAERSSSLSSNGVGGGAGGNGATSIQTPGVVYDVACCDGPVRFHRVLNENYAPAAVQASATQPPPPHRATVPQCNGRSNSSSSSSSISSNCRAVVEPTVDNLSTVIRENDENEQRQPSSLASNNNSENRSSGSYTCGYCQHTFKSQYCYRKHARRHLLPTDGENVVTERQLVQPQPPAAPAQQQQQQQQPQQVPARATAAAQQPEVKKREVRLLDLNVQYYPCKICGSKFPSYYFVHKHRKLCHANVDDPPQSSSSQNNSRSASEEPQQTKATTTMTGGAATQLQQAASTSENAQQQQPA